MPTFGPPERVYVELDWYDGPREGVADIGGVPHRFKSLFDEADDEYLGTFVVFPIHSSDLRLELEQWKIFVSWNARYESGAETVASHPGHGGVNSRWDEIDSLLKASRTEIPDGARKALAQFERLDSEARYEESGPDYAMRWHIL